MALRLASGGYAVWLPGGVGLPGEPTPRWRPPRLASGLRCWEGPAGRWPPPWQSCYTDPDGLLFGSDTLAARGWYRRYGLEFDAKNREPDDHIGLMLSFLAVLADRERALLEAGQPTERIEEDQLVFIERHPATFVGRWAEACAESTSFLYAGLALLAQAAVEGRARDLREVLGCRAIGPCGCAG